MLVSPVLTRSTPAVEAGDPSGDQAAPPAHETSPRGPGPWARAWRAGAAYWLICHVFYAAVQLTALRFSTPSGGSLLSEVVHSLVRLDGLRYVDIAEFGYHPVTDPTFRDPASVTPVWPPGYPILIRLASYVLPGDMAFAAVAVSNLAALGLLVMLYRFVDHEFGRDMAQRSVVALIAFPTAFFLGVAYSESVFLLLTVASLYCARRGNWWVAGALAGAASATRVVGVMIGVALAYEYLRQRGFNWRRIRLDVLSLALAPTGLLLYMVFLWYRFDNPMLFSDAQINWDRRFAFPWETIAQSMRNVDFAGDRTLAVINIVDVGALVFGLVFLVLSLVGPWRLGTEHLSIVLAGGLPFLLAVSQPLWLGHSSPLLGMNRYALAVLPMYFVLAKMTANRSVEMLMLFAFLPVQMGLLLVYVQGGWAG